ncbi:MFS transporter, PPP family, 3-phenylpropionic acid transporter [Paenibacillus sp. UNCCL117]|uniref:MFS transporter n=1 Tax=unclassified Paenibacillus TaxID=185978 RepID=UPI00088F45C2|nr:MULTISPECIES: MFS transporter [unclassified Paenibacillus]SDC22065.1 MFS transporter, PPP family, 3-phenylpropionic acid transporter [Paenibacillus sp. cl123]SFW18949.1 MFS transporter, PPP family, 3-phenylpropionic acid transporter [Paenibacillus sp. UNCCL117]
MKSQLLKLRGLNLTYYATTGVLNPFLPLYLGERGYSSSQIGLLMMIGPFVTIFAQPLWGYISDRYQALKLILLSLWAMTVMSSFGVFGLSGYVSAFIFMLLLYFFMLSSSPLLDSLSLRVADRAGASYGSVRMWGSAGYMLMAISSGFVLQALGGLKSLPYLYWLIWLFPLAVLFMVRDERSESGNVVSMADFARLLKNRQFVWFLFLVFLLMLPHRMNDSLLALHLKDLGGSDMLVGWAWALAAGSEIPTFALFGRYLSRFHELALLGVVAILYTVRWLLFGLIDDPLLLTVLQASHCVTFALFWITSVQYVVRLVPGHLQSTGQSLLSMVFLGLAGIGGGYGGGFVKDWLGGSSMYLIGAGLAAVAAALLLGTHAYRRNRKHPVL